MKGWIRVFLAVVFSSGTLFMVQGLASGAWTGGMASFDIRLPSDSTGEGTLAVRVYAPTDRALL